MKDRFFWRIIAVGVVLGLFAVAYGLCRNSHLPSISSSAHAAEATPETTGMSKEYLAQFPEKDRLSWEHLSKWNSADHILRAKVEGGWLVKLENMVGTAIGITFYPDPQHSWNGASLK